eukprot:jgi/Chlat1/4030/Chrsp26S04087
MSAAAALPGGAVFLGLDISTQSCKVTAVGPDLAVTASVVVNYDAELPHYATKDGVHRAESDPQRITSPPLMWVEALEAAFLKFQQQGFAFNQVKAVSGSGQQHGSVYWRTGASQALQTLDPAKTLAEHLKDAFVTDSPIWMDSSTTEHCRVLEDAVGGPLRLAELTGSTAKERFTGPQIRKIKTELPQAYAQCERISLVSSFGASLLTGAYASIDHSDAAGMNLMELRTRQWHPELVQTIDSELQSKLGDLAPAHAVAGVIHPYYCQKFGFPADCNVINFSGDNPCSAAGLALSNPGDLSVSLGTSDTVFGIVEEPKANLWAMMLPNPTDPSSYISMVVYKNGSLARQDVRDRCSGKSWEEFGRQLSRTEAGNLGQLGFYIKFDEITPHIAAGVYRFDANGQIVERFEDDVEVRAIVEGQFLSMRNHSEECGMPIPPKRLISTGGASANAQILQLLADVFGCAVYTSQSPDSAPYGAALRAAHGWVNAQHDSFIPFGEVLKLAAAHMSWVKVAEPNQQHGEVLERTAVRRAELERNLLHSNSAGVH